MFFAYVRSIFVLPDGLPREQVYTFLFWMKEKKQMTSWLYIIHMLYDHSFSFMNL